jgi:C-terminal processing protease CtpA/Prc
VAYLRTGPFYNEAAKTSADEWDVAGFRAFIDKAFRDFNAKGARSLIVDLRDNPGGDSLFSDVMVSWFADRPYQFFSSFKIRVSPDTVAANRDRIAHDAVAAGPISQRFAELYASVPAGAVAEFRLPPSQPNRAEKFSGRVFALINRRTYSNAVAVAATIQDYRFGKVLGEPTSDMASAFGAMEHFTLPRTGIVVGYPKAHIIRPSGDARLRGVVPDIGLAFPVIETPDDPVLQQAAAIARR